MVFAPGRHHCRWQLPADVSRPRPGTGSWQWCALPAFDLTPAVLHSQWLDFRPTPMRPGLFCAPFSVSNLPGLWRWTDPAATCRRRLLTHLRSVIMNCLDCSTESRISDAVGVCTTCGAGVCTAHLELDTHVTAPFVGVGRAASTRHGRSPARPARRCWRTCTTIGTTRRPPPHLPDTGDRREPTGHTSALPPCHCAQRGRVGGTDGSAASAMQGQHHEC